MVSPRPIVHSLSRRLGAVVFDRTALATFLSLWLVAAVGAGWLASGTMPAPLAAAYDLVFIKLLMLPGIGLASVAFPDLLFDSVVGLVLVASVGYVLVSVAVSAARHAVDRARRSRETVV